MRKLMFTALALALTSHAYASSVGSPIGSAGVGATSETGALQASGAYASIDMRVFYDVGNDKGGKVIDYVVKREVLRNDRTIVRFNGSCDSACTLYITLPACVTSEAQFRFHAPFGPVPKEVAFARSYVWKEYPSWVRQYINDHGGFNHRLITMPYTYAAKYLPTCD